MDMSDNQQLMEITARTVSIARSMAVDYEQLRVLTGISELLKGKTLSPESIMLIHEIRKIVRNTKG